jgi:peptidoglycan/xylan/chitin deacetylase (PgdA/CDA1 family)
VRYVGSWKAFESEFGLQLPVLLYHNIGVSSSGSKKELHVSPEEFRRQMGWLAENGYVGIRTADWLAWVREAKPLPPKPVLITFDDGYANVARNALPVVREHGFSATVFVITGMLGNSTPWDGERLMSHDDVREWGQRGIDFGSHSHSHSDLTKMEEPRIIEELRAGVDELERLAGQRPVAFAYPYGRWTTAMTRYLQSRFQAAFTIEEGLNDLRSDPLQLRRTFVPPGRSMAEFAWRVRLGFNPLEKLRAQFPLRAILRKLFSAGTDGP